MTACRVCMKISEKTISIFTKVSNRSFADMIIDICGVDITEVDELPKICCKKCCTQIKSAFKIRICCQQSDAKFRGNLQKMKKGDEEVEEKCRIEYEVEESELPNYETACYQEEIQQEREDFKLELRSSPDGNENMHIQEQEVEFYDIKTETVTEESFEENNEINENDYCTSDEEPIKKTNESKRKKVVIQIEKTMNSCCGCEAFFETKEQLEKHSRKVHETERVVGDADRPHECTVCFKRYTTERGLKTHHKYLYQDKAHQCLHCGKRFSNKTILTYHERSHTGERPFACATCQKSFASKANLLAHEKLHNEIPENTLHLCKICGNGFSRKSYLKHHYNLHSGETPFQCRLCPSKFKAKQNLRLHMRVHTGEKPYSCDFCERKFSHPSDKKRHQMNHTGVKPFKCQFCTKAFTRKTLAQKHERIHTGERPFECEICCQKFSSSSYLKTHTQSHYMAAKVESQDKEVVVEERNDSSSVITTC